MPTEEQLGTADSTSPPTGRGRRAKNPSALLAATMDEDDENAMSLPRSQGSRAPRSAAKSGNSRSGRKAEEKGLSSFDKPLHAEMKRPRGRPSTASLAAQGRLKPQNLPLPGDPLEKAAKSSPTLGPGGEVVKRGRGRPKGSTNANKRAQQAAAAAAAAAAQQQQQQRASERKAYSRVASYTSMVGIDEHDINR